MSEATVKATCRACWLKLDQANRVQLRDPRPRRRPDGVAICAALRQSRRVREADEYGVCCNEQTGVSLRS